MAKTNNKKINLTGRVEFVSAQEFILFRLTALRFSKITNMLLNYDYYRFIRIWKQTVSVCDWQIGIHRSSACVCVTQLFMVVGSSHVSPSLDMTLVRISRR